VHLRQLWLSDFRNHRSTALTLPPGLTVVTGANGEGKTNLLEAIAWLATQRSFRNAANDVLIRQGAEAAVIRAELDDRGRRLLVEAAIEGERTRFQVNRQRVRRSRDALGYVLTTVFTPDDLQVVKGGPAGRRRFLDDVAVSTQPSHHELAGTFDRIVRQRNVLLRQAGGRLDSEAEATLQVWDAQLVEAGTRLVEGRLAVLGALAPLVAHRYAQLTTVDAGVQMRYEAPWRELGLAEALAASRRDEVRRGVTLVGPHRDDLVVILDRRPARTHASQGEQRSLALALRLGGHALAVERNDRVPLVLLDDVFSELDEARAEALVSILPQGQTLLTTATGNVPGGTTPDLVLEVHSGRVATVPVNRYPTSVRDAPVTGE